MKETHPDSRIVRRVALPLLLVLALIVITVAVSGSVLNSLDDVQRNRVIAGTYGTPDWRVQKINPLLSQVLTVLYRVIPQINWYGVMLLALLALAAAAIASIAGRKRGGLIPALMIVSPLVVLFTYSMQSAIICALCSAAGAFSLMDGVKRKKEGANRAIFGAVLFGFGAMLDIRMAAILAACAALCWVPLSYREERVRGFVVGVPLLAVLLVALFGYSALMYQSPELSAYRSDYARYERLQHSSLKAEQERLLEKYGVSAYLNEVHDEAEHDHTDENDADHTHDEQTIVEPNVFDTVGWSINDASLFFTRYGADAKLTDPDTLRVLDLEADHFDFSVDNVAGGLWKTIKKPQTLLLIALFVISALGLLISNRKRGLVVLLAAAIALGGHIYALASYYDTFEAIAPFYLLAIIAMLFHFDGESAGEWLKRAISSHSVRFGTCGLALALFAAALTGIIYYTAKTPINDNAFTVEAIELLTPYIKEHKEMLFIGDNPNDRMKPSTLKAPGRGDDENLLAGSYDLYSPRAAAMMQAYGIENPLPDSLDRDDIRYIIMTFTDPMAFRLASGYDKYLKEPVDLLTLPQYSEKICGLVAYTEEEVQQALDEAKLQEEQAALWAEALKDLEEQGLLDELLQAKDEEHIEAETPTEAPTEAPTPVPTATPTAVPTPTPTEAPTAQPFKSLRTTQTAVPTEVPTAAPTPAPTEAPTAEPLKSLRTTQTAVPTETPTEAPTPEPFKSLRTTQTAAPASLDRPTAVIVTPKPAAPAASPITRTIPAATPVGG